MHTGQLKRESVEFGVNDSGLIEVPELVESELGEGRDAGVDDHPRPRLEARVAHVQHLPARHADDEEPRRTRSDASQSLSIGIHKFLIYFLTSFHNFCFETQFDINLVLDINLRFNDNQCTHFAILKCTQKLRIKNI